MLDKNAFLERVRSSFSFLEREWGFKFRGVEGQLPEFWVTYASPDDCRVVVSLEVGSRPWVEVSFPALGAEAAGKRTNASLASVVRAESKQVAVARVAEAFAGVEDGRSEAEAIEEDAEILRRYGHAILSGDPGARARVAAESARAWCEAQA